MEFRPLLQILEIGFGSQVFSSKNALQVIYDPILIESQTDIGRYLRSILPISPKMISKDLDRLYKMGFLYRAQEKRQVKTRKSKVCNKGFEYRYSLSRQGHSYVQNYLWNPRPRKPRKEMIENLDLLMREYIKHQTSSQEETEAHLAWYETISPCKHPRPIDKRFPIRRDPYLVELLLRVTKERDQYKNELPEIRKQIDDLKQQSS